MIQRPSRRPIDEVACLGEEIYERSIREHVQDDHHGEVVAIDVDTEDYEVGDTTLTAADILRERHPDAEIWLRRVGYNALYHFGGRSLGQRRTTTK